MICKKKCYKVNLHNKNILNNNNRLKKKHICLTYMKL